MCGGGGGGASAAQNLMAVSQFMTAQRQQDLAEKQYGDTRELMGEFMPYAREAAEESSALRQQGLGMSQELMDRWRGTFKPVEDRVINDAMNYDSDSRIQLEAGKADAAVMSAYDRAQKSAARDSLRLGINPTSGKALAIRENGALGTALAQATASSATSEGIRQQAMQMRERAAAMGTSTLAGANTAAGIGLNAGSLGLNAYGTASSIQTGGFNSAMQGFGAAASTMGSAAGQAASIQQQNNAAAQASSNQAGSLIGAGIGAVGSYAAASALAGGAAAAGGATAGAGAAAAAGAALFT